MIYMIFKLKEKYVYITQMIKKLYQKNFSFLKY